MASQQLVNIIIKAVDEASATAQKVDNSLKKIGNTSSRLSKIPGFDTLRTKISSVASTLDGKMGGALSKAMNKFNSLKSRVTGVASTVKSKLGSALDGVRSKLSALGNGLKNTASSMSFLKGTVSMTAGMLGYDLVNSIMETTKASLNARSSMQAFASRLNMSATEVKNFQASLDEMQNSYKKIDMDVVGQQATDMAYRLGLPKQSLSELTETTAIFTDAMQRNGRSAEDSMMAMSDAMDGQFTRLKEIGIGQEDLMRNGWSGDINDKTGLLKAMNKALKEQHYDDLAKSVDTLDDAWQVLSITMGNLLESVLVPLTPVIVGLINGLMDFFNLIKTNPLAQAVAVIGGLTIGFVLLAGSMVTAEGAFIGFEALMPGFIGSLYSAASGFMAISWAGAPLWAIVAAVAAIAFAVYEVGIAFGWWKDVGSMLEAISAGVKRLWSAFINNPDVQAALTAISGALQVLWGWIVQAGQAILEFFGITTGGEFDIVRALIDGIGNAWAMVKSALDPVITAVWNVINAFNQFRAGQIDLPTLILTVLTTLVNLYITIWSRILGLVAQFGSQIVARARSAAMNMVNGVVNWLRQLPGRAYSQLIAVVSRIVSAGQQWINNARNKASEVVNSVYNKLSELPDKISSALSGVISAITSPFQNAYDTVCGIVDNIKQKVEDGLNYIGSLGGALPQGGETLPMGGDTSYDITTAVGWKQSNQKISVEETKKIILDLINVPAHIDTATLIKMMEKPEVLKALTSNREFQALDNKTKLEIQKRINRAKGV